MDNKKIGLFISSLRKEKNLTQQELAEMLLTTRETISKWERGVYVPNMEFMIKMKDIFKVSVSEIYYGERKTTDNEEDIENNTAKVIKNKENKMKRYIVISITVISILVALFSAFYFINNYNSIKVYRIYGGDDNIYLNEGIMIVSPEKCYIHLGSIKNETKHKIIKIRLFYKKHDKENLIFMDYQNNITSLIINDFGYEEYFKYKDLKYIKNNLFLEIGFENNNVIINLNLEKDFSNSYIFNDKKIQNVSEGDIVDKKNSVTPQYIKNNFKYDKQDDKYYLTIKKGTMRINKEYFNDMGVYLIDEQNDNDINHYDYFLNDGTLIYNRIDKETVTENFTYNINTQKCISSNCSKKLIEHFKEQYLNDVK